jgi:hypothetical protein
MTISGFGKVVAALSKFTGIVELLSDDLSERHGIILQDTDSLTAVTSY